MIDPEHAPVIVGVGEVVQRPGDGTLDPASLAAEAVRRAAEDAGHPDLLAIIDSLDVVNVVGWSYPDIAAEIAGQLGAMPRRSVHSDVGGHQPIRLLDDAAARIAAGASEVAVVAGAEAMRTLETALRGGQMPPWPAPPPDAKPVDPRDHAAGAMAELGLFLPTEVYPLYEQASRAHLGLSQREARADSANRWARAADVAASNPTAWIQEPPSAEAIATVSATNRLVAWPYPKLLNAFLSVDQAAAVVVVSASRARALGIAEDRWVHVCGGTGAAEPVDVLSRSTFTRTTAGGTTLDRTLAMHGLSVHDLDLIELYSCFPCVPRMAAAHLGLPPEHPTTVTGGLTFFGGPANDYMTHAVAAMVRQMREGRGSTGFLYGQGGYATKHHAVVIAAEPLGGFAVDDRTAAQRIVDNEPKPRFLRDYTGPGVIETFTITFGRDGAASRAVLVGRTSAGDRFAGEMPPDNQALEVLTDDDAEPVGRQVHATSSGGSTSVELV